MDQMIAVLAAIGAGLAILPAAIFLRNLSVYRPLPLRSSSGCGISVLIPARDEETRIGAALRSILKCPDVDLEVIVLDDGSTDRTAEVVRQFAAKDSRVRLETAAPLPDGWCGKNFACHQLAGFARHPILLFLDADVRMTRADTLGRLTQLFQESGTAFASGFPRQETGTLAERIIIPLIHFVLLGFLPMRRMRKTTAPHFAAACGQLIAVRRNEYEQAGGHRAIAQKIHDGMMLARNFRAHGFATELFDATDCFTCRMYKNGREVWNGFLKNTLEGLGSPRLIGPTTLVLLGGQVLPFYLFITATATLPLALAVVGVIAAFLPRLIGLGRFRQSLFGALLHPIGVSIFVAIQWYGLFRSFRRRPVTWKGRSYIPLPAA